MKTWLAEFILRLRNRHLIPIDLLILCAAPALALVARLESIPLILLYNQEVQLYLILTVPVKLVVFYAFGFYQRYWRMASVEELRALVLGSVTAGAASGIIFVGIYTFVDWFNAPRSFPIIESVITAFGVTGVRLGVRLAYDFAQSRVGHVSPRRTLVIGAGAAGAMIVRELRMKPQVGLLPVAFVDDDRRKMSVFIHGVPVVGTIEDIPRIVAAYAVEEVVIAMPSAPGRIIRRVTELCAQAHVPSKTVPALFEILDGSAQVSDLRHVQVEDLLRRSAVRTDTTLVASLIEGRRVLVTGAGGSIGSELCRQICRYGPSQIILLGHGENSIFRIAAELRSTLSSLSPAPDVVAIIADIRDAKRMHGVFRQHRPQIVFHAAAHKHVGLMESNIVEAVSNNVWGTKVVADQCVDHGVERLVMISSDKAVNPSSVMGVTKRMAELVVKDTARSTGSVLTAVRFGNVLGSRGSVVPIFQRQLAAGGPITVSHPHTTRFFMTIPEAVQLVLQASALASGGEVFVLDMGDPVNIRTMAEDFVRLSGSRVGVDVDIIYTGLTAGEKMHEELAYDFERVERSSHDKVLVCSENGHADDHWEVLARSLPEVLHAEGQGRYRLVRQHFIVRLVEAARNGSVDMVEQFIRKIVPQYAPTPFVPAPTEPASDLEEGASAGEDEAAPSE